MPHGGKKGLDPPHKPKMGEKGETSKPGSLWMLIFREKGRGQR